MSYILGIIKSEFMDVVLIFQNKNNYCGIIIIRTGRIFTYFAQRSMRQYTAALILMFKIF